MITPIVRIIEISSHPLICPLLCPKFSVSKIYYCVKILKKTDFIVFIDLVSYTD